jgi:hypothetical protein
MLPSSSSSQSSSFRIAPTALTPTSPAAGAVCDRPASQRSAKRISRSAESLSNGTLRISHGALRASNEALRASNRTLSASHAALSSSHGRPSASNGALSVSHEALRASNEALRASNRRLRDSNGGLSVPHRALRASHGRLRTPFPWLSLSFGPLESLRLRQRAYTQSAPRLNERQVSAPVTFPPLTATPFHSAIRNPHSPEPKAPQELSRSAPATGISRNQ